MAGDAYGGGGIKPTVDDLYGEGVELMMDDVYGGGGVELMMRMAEYDMMNCQI
jgi:hypothetical protein